MHAANDFVINDSATPGKTIKGIAKLLPKFDQEVMTAFIVESIDPIDSHKFV
jgi:adenine/guanine phosphoribosyltransferase-like PRPP-binding protein